MDKSNKPDNKADKNTRTVPVERYARMSRIAAELAYSMEHALDTLVGKDQRKVLMSTLSEDAQVWWRKRKAVDKMARKAKKETKAVLKKAAAR